MTGPALVDSLAYGDARPGLSVLIPFFRDDPCGLVEALDQEARGLVGQVEIVVLDDGSGDPDLAGRVAAAIKGLSAPARFIRLFANEGRARGRNRLVDAARAERLLFLDADMAPDAADFLGRYLGLIAAEQPMVAFGGFTLDRTPDDPRRGLHRAMSLAGDCRSAAERQLEPAKSLCTSNLLVHRQVFAEEPFDEAFRGWGWEDVEWAIRVGRRWPIRHIDNPASHLGLDTDEALIAKYDQSGANFARMRTKHPEAVAAFPVARAAARLASAPLPRVWRPVLRRLSLTRSAPMPVRVAAAKLYRAALYAEAR